MLISQEEKKQRRREYKRKRIAENREKYRERNRKWIAEHREEYREYMRTYKSGDRKKMTIRHQSREYLLSKHAKLSGYEIHHCFGYENPRRFIYIPKQLHTQIHQLLRDNKISADMDHWIAIRDLVNSCEQYTYISEG